MARLLLIGLIVIVVLALLAKLVRELRSASIDWTGVTLAIGFVALAFWLRHVTGMG